ncbi:kynurenine 3-monooxygenase [Emericellopsis atlantica]|uniref:Kynurenine 3-monooxygenase n=1 Tax=Emericellopsis atlantica TaxID=2614577 RepID=A0A9P7ZL78_9HYPO|nr:kynurenine 3-monooxygenase [Emericellopsis atlantica]KAG9253761.1 kynurenine 3-monooxygenase [Emericellopsis atlantica]
MTQPLSIAIIGAGLSGLCLALALHQEQIPCVIYETRAEPLDIGGAIMLSPNALRILDQLGVYERLQPLGYNFDHLYFRTETDQLLDTFEFGGKDKFGYSGMRVYRFELIKVLLAMLSEVGIAPQYGKKFSHVVSEDESSVTWAFDDGSSSSASLLVGADGIHSRVRSYLHPDVSPTFTKMVGVSASVPTSQLGVGKDYTLPVTIMNRKHGAFIAAPQRKDGSEMFIGKQCPFTEDLDRAGWDRVLNDKQWCIDFLRKGQEDYPPIVASAVSRLEMDKINLWPFYVIPKLASWMSSKGRVVILGDAAHAIPPTAGQGVNQAFEDVYTFSRVMARFQRSLKGVASMVLRRWQEKRQLRVDGVLALNATINKRRLPSALEDPMAAEGFDLGWLYNIEYEEFVEEITGSA